MAWDPTRLSQLVARLTPLARAQRGSLIRAQDWNDLVTSVLDVVRSVYGVVDAPAKVPPHTHENAVTADWLTETLRARIERGAGTVQEQLDGLDRRVRDLRAASDGIAGTASDQRGRLLEVETRGLGFGKELDAVRDALDRVRAGQSDVSDLRLSFTRIEERVSKALELGDRLTVGGQPVDMEGLNRRLVGVEELRDRLRTPAGALLDAVALDARFLAAENRFATKEELSEVASTRGAGLTTEERAALEGSLRSGLSNELEGRTRELESRLTQVTQTALADVDGRVQRRLDEALPAVRTAITSAAVSEATRSAGAALDAAIAGVRRELDEVARAIRADVQLRVEGLSSDLTKLVRTTLDRELPERLSGFEQAISELRVTTAKLSDEIRSTGGRVDGLALRSDALAAQEAEARSSLGRTLLDEVVRRDTAQLTSIDARIADAARLQAQQVEKRLTETGAALLSQTRALAAETARTEVRLLDQIRPSPVVRGKERP